MTIRHFISFMPLVIELTIPKTLFFKVRQKFSWEIQHLYFSVDKFPRRIHQFYLSFDSSNKDNVKCNFNQKRGTHSQITCHGAHWTLWPMCPVAMSNVPQPGALWTFLQQFFKKLFLVIQVYYANICNCSS